MPSRVSVSGIAAQQWLGRTLQRFLRPGALLVAVVDATYAVCQILREQEVPSASDWTRHQPLGWLLFGSAVGALVGTLLVVAGYTRSLRRSGQHDDLQEACKGVWRLMVERFNVPMDRVGVHVWEIRGVWGFRYLHRRASFVIRGRRNTPHVVWGKGKGAIGIAWDEDDWIVGNVEALRLQAADEETFAAMSLRERFGLTWREFRRTSRRHKAVLAVPIRTRGHVRGVFSIDLQIDGHAQDLATLASGDEFANVLGVCEAVFEGRR